MANLGKQKVSSKLLSNVGRKKNLFEPGKFPQPIQNVKAATPTTDLSDYRQPQPGEMITNVMGSLSSSQSVPARGGNMTPVNQLKPSYHLNSPATEPVQKHEETFNQTGLPDDLKAGVENLSGYSLDDVRVHYNSPKPAQLQAHAYTQGTEIHVASGQEEHLPHEAWHVVQQMQGRVKPTMQMKGVEINNDEGLEREAEAIGSRIGRNKGHGASRPKNIQGRLNEAQRTGEGRGEVVQRARWVGGYAWRSYVWKEANMVAWYWQGKKYHLNTTSQTFHITHEAGGSLGHIKYYFHNTAEGLVDAQPQQEERGTSKAYKKEGRKKIAVSRNNKLSDLPDEMQEWFKENYMSILAVYDPFAATGDEMALSGYEQ
ncbi:MAG: DUF4157 domain-containing protein [Nostoc sp.]|uniref:eCIS core domain-containing protein n=1 Tax=Nostoc sp. TaxID=1180 RepID=UPI002FF749F6